MNSPNRIASRPGGAMGEMRCLERERGKKTDMAYKRMAVLPILLALAACSPKVQLEAPKEPIVIDLNINIQHEVRIKVEKEVEDLFKNNEDLFGEIK